MDGSKIISGFFNILSLNEPVCLTTAPNYLFHTKLSPRRFPAATVCSTWNIIKLHLLKYETPISCNWSSWTQDVSMFVFLFSALTCRRISSIEIGCTRHNVECVPVTQCWFLTAPSMNLWRRNGVDESDGNSSHWSCVFPSSRSGPSVLAEKIQPLKNVLFSFGPKKK